MTVCAARIRTCVHVSAEPKMSVLMIALVLASPFFLFVFVCILVHTIYSMHYREIVISSGVSFKAEQKAAKTN